MSDSLTISEAMDAVFREFGAPEIEEGEFTEVMYQERTGLTEQTTNRQLNQAVKAGKVTRRKVRYQGRRVWAYRVVDPTQK